ncbi:MAG TPA: 2,3-bisphosphoglycerate-independent phosphoglycerate mutase [Stellaceae bacterium]|jgi:2,3-bisphosphoglycerate-independent phosphoglycerate mutase|nr:2,3-bisphosphoglycerate-independent phosphoglycerate mutase [Stellaceae bacterium]
MTSRPRPLVLCILDGWGERPPKDDNPEDNAIERAKTPVWHKLMEKWPHAHLEASEHYVGLPDGQMGNSEVGHTNLGAGRVVLQDLPRIDKAIADNEVADLPAMQDLIKKVKAGKRTVHVAGLLSPGGVHSHQHQIAALAAIVGDAGVPVAVHAFLDGRDTPPKSAVRYLQQFEKDVAGHGDIKIATVCGRYYAMDRDKRWDRVAEAYAALTEGKGEQADAAAAAVEASYKKDETDEFVLPTVIGDYKGMKDGDGLLFANFRADRIREIAGALLDPKFDGFKRGQTVKFAASVGLVEYSTDLNEFLETLFPPEDLQETFGEVVSENGLKQLRIAETEKYAHVTFFFNGGRETVFDGEERILVPSPKVATYDKQPEMSAPEVTDKVVAAIGSGKFDVVVLNYANTDMVGHTGKIDATVKAVEAVDACLGRLSEAVEKAGGSLVITADHGNAEMLRDPETGEPHTAHTTNPVPFIVVNAPGALAHVENGRLADVAPTLLDLLGLPKPAAMTGHSLIVSDQRRAAE